jgi:hypothetical protein
VNTNQWPCLGICGSIVVDLGGGGGGSGGVGGSGGFVHILSPTRTLTGALVAPDRFQANQ